VLLRGRPVCAGREGEREEDERLLVVGQKLGEMKVDSGDT